MAASIHLERPTMAEMEARMRELGEEPSAASWEDDEHVYCYSKRLAGGRSLYGHAVILHWQAAGEWYTEGGDIDPRHAQEITQLG